MGSGGNAVDGGGGVEGHGSSDLRRAPFRRRLRQSWSGLSRSEQAVGNYLLDDPSLMAFETLRSVAARIGTSERSVTRFAQRLGYSGFASLQEELRGVIETRLSSPRERFHPNHDADAEGSILRQYADQAIKNVSGLVDAGMDDLLEGAREIASCVGSIYIYGAGKASSAARYLWHGLVLVHPRCRLVYGADADVLDEVFDVGSEDIVIVFDFRRYHRSSELVAAAVRRNEPYVVTIADSEVSPFGLIANVTCVVSTRSPFLADSYVGVFALVDVLVGLVAQELEPERVTARLEAHERALENARMFRSSGVGSGLRFMKTEE